VKLSTTSQELLGQLQTASRVASTRSAVQALSGVQVHAAGGEVELRATDMEIGLRVPLIAQVEREGTVVLPARLMLDVARQLPSGPLTLELRSSEQDVEIICGTARFHIRTLRTEDFPTLPEPGGDQVGRAARQGLRRDRGEGGAVGRRGTRRGPSSPASSCPPAARSCGWSPRTPTA
jgi:DNA polymerase-3 subunit beta